VHHTAPSWAPGMVGPGLVGIGVREAMRLLSEGRGPKPRDMGSMVPLPGSPSGRCASSLPTAWDDCAETPLGLGTPSQSPGLAEELAFLWVMAHPRAGAHDQAWQWQNM
jgi:hypothetical protein